MYVRNYIGTFLHNSALRIMSYGMMLKLMYIQVAYSVSNCSKGAP